MTASAKPIRLYRPSNGSEGSLFIEQWCGSCARDPVLSEGKDPELCDDSDFCPIAPMSMAYGVNDAEYPKQWRYDAGGHPCCTAWVEAFSEVPPLRCEFTIDMFEELMP